MAYADYSTNVTVRTHSLLENIAFRRWLIVLLCAPLVKEHVSGLGEHRGCVHRRDSVVVELVPFVVGLVIGKGGVVSTPEVAIMILTEAC